MATALIAGINAFISIFVTVKFPVRISVLLKCCYKLPEKQNIQENEIILLLLSNVEILHPLQVQEDIRNLEIYSSCNKIYFVLYLLALHFCGNVCFPPFRHS